jgi:hypothetical protein
MVYVCNKILPYIHISLLYFSGGALYVNSVYLRYNICVRFEHPDKVDDA